MKAYAAHLFGTVADSSCVLRPVFEEMGIMDIYEVRELFIDGDYDKLPPGLPEEAKSLEMLVGEEDIMYIGMSAIMPYQRPLATKKNIYRAVDLFVKYLFGDDKRLACGDIFDTWIE